MIFKCLGITCQCLLPIVLSSFYIFHGLTGIIKKQRWPVNFTASGSDLFLSRTEKHSVPGTKDSNLETYDKCLTRSRLTIWFPAKYEESSKKKMLIFLVHCDLACSNSLQWICSASGYCGYGFSCHEEI